VEFYAELPVGKEKLLGNSKGSLKAGRRMADCRHRQHQAGLFPLPTGNPTANPIEYYGLKYPSGLHQRPCPGSLYYNGYIPANRINSVDTR
jgi:hypothetical protein